MKINALKQNGVATLLLDPQKGVVVVYDTELHNIYGGKPTYVSNSGASQQGWFPASSGLVEVSGYRTDVGARMMQNEIKVKKIGDISFPYNYGSGVTDADYPTIVAVQQYEAYSDVIMPGVMYSRPMDAVFAASIEFEAIGDVWDEMYHEWSCEVWGEEARPDAPLKWVFTARYMEYKENVYPRGSRAKTLKVLESIFQPFKDETWGFSNRGTPKKFENAADTLRHMGWKYGLGSYEQYRRLVPIKVVDPHNPSAMEIMAAESTANFTEVIDNGAGVVVISSSSTEDWVISAAFLTPLGWYDYERYESKMVAVAAMGSEYRRGTLVNILRESAMAKYQRDQETLDKKAAEATAMGMENPEPPAAFAETEITISTSNAAGNCIPGTERFRDEHFPGRDSVLLRELWPFRSQQRVYQVIRHIIMGPPPVEITADVAG
jgi:hypothetical protein